MHYCSASAVRNLTLLTLVVLSSHSFVLVNAEGSSSSEVAPSSTPQESSTSAVSSPSPPPSSSESSSVSSTLPPPSSTQISSSPEPSSTPPPSSQKSTTPSSASAAPSSSLTDSQSLSESDSSSASSTATTSSSASDSSSSVPISSGTASGTSSTSSVSPTGLTVSPNSGASAASAAPQATHYGPASYMSVTIEKPTGTNSDSPSETGAAAAASTPKSFLQNKGAVAGVFTVVGVVGLAVISYIVYKIMRRRARLRDEEDDVFFEKYRDPEPVSSGNNNNLGPSDSSFNVATTPAAPDAYPDRTTHFGPSRAAAYENPQQYGAQYPQQYPQQYDMEYPPGTAYAAAQSGAQYQYTGQTGGYDNAAGYAPSSNGHGHPFADPNHAPRAQMAPRVAYGGDQYYSNGPGIGQAR